VEFLDALGLDRVHLVGHDWGGIIATKVALDHGHRLETLSLVDTLTSVWIPWGIHGYWFKCEPQAEEFFAGHGRSFVASLFAGEQRDYGGPPDSPWAPVAGSEGSAAMSTWDSGRHYTPEDADHFISAFDDPDVWFHAVEYYRHALPFHVERPDPTARHGHAYEFLTSPTVAAMWNHPGLLFSHPDYGSFPVFAPEDRHKQFAGPTLFLFSPFLMPQAFVDGALPPDDYVPAGNLYAESFPRHFPDLRSRGALCGHFVPEEAPERTNAVLSAFLADATAGS
jgi:pimeloyl-ACP methyl ester carboxylesterase